MKKTAIAELSRCASNENEASFPARRRGVNAVGSLLALVGLSFLAWFRLPEVTRGTVWAEDAVVFLADAISFGPWQSIVSPYAGYLHTVPRVVAAIAYSVAPIENYATMMSLLSCVVVAAISVGSYVLSGQLFEHRRYRLMVAAIPVLVPVGPLEVLGNAANLHWYMLWFCPWLLIYRPRTWYSGLSVFAAMLAAATTEILVGFFFPLAIWAAFWKKNYWAPAALVLGSGIQLAATILEPRYSAAPAVDATEPLSVLYGFLLQPVGSIWMSDPHTMATNIATFGGFAVAVPCVIVFGLLAYILVYGHLRWKAVAMYAFAAAAACWTAATVLNPSPEFDFPNFTREDWLTVFTFFRYAAAPSMFLLVLVPVACAVAEDRKLIVAGRAKYWAPTLMVVFLSIHYFQATTTRQTGPEWAAAVQDAAARCNGDSALPEVSIPVTPEGWRVSVNCAILRGR
ncbi:hypothetical protein ACTAQI_08040 [Pseudarthrobacter sp. alpha12b]